MKRLSASLFIVGLSAALAAAFLGCRHGQGGTSQAAALAGAELYSRNCLACHGAHGEGVKGMGPRLQQLSIRIPDDSIRFNITHGRGRMPAFKELSEADVNAIMTYIKKF